MNRAEYAALFDDSHISDRERTLYLYLRWHMDYDTGIVGQQRKISYQSIREHLEYKPERGSKEPASYPTKDQVKRLLRKLERYGWIEPLHSKRIGEHMVFRLVLSNAGSIRPNEERHMSATRAAPQEKPINSGVPNDMSAKGAPREERHTSDPSVKRSLSLARERAKTDVDDTHSTIGSQLDWDTDFETTARLAGLNIELEFLLGIFESFRFHQKHRSTLRARNDWLAEWRVWCGREKGYGNHQTRTSGRAGGNQRPENPTARLLRESKEAAAELARTGYYDARDESDEDPSF